MRNHALSPAQYQALCLSDCFSDPRLAAIFRRGEDGEPLESDGKPVTIDLLGIGSDVSKAKAKEIDKRRTQGETIDTEKQAAELLASVTTGWSNIGLGSNKALPFSYENAVRLYSDPDAEWITEQVFPFINDRKNFVKGLSNA